jgi:hypothetical protein
MKQITWIVISIVLLLAACSSEPQQSEVADPPLATNDFGTAGFDRAKDVAARKGSGVVVVGNTTGSLDGPTKGGGDAFIRGYDSRGVLWAEQFGTRGFDDATDVVVDPTGLSYVAGETNGALGFKKGSTDAFLRKYDAKGIAQWTRQFGDVSFDNVFDIALDKSNNIYVLGGVDVNGLVIRKFNANGTLLQTITNTDPNIRSFNFAFGIDSTGTILVLTRYNTGTKFVAKLLRYNSAGMLLDSPVVFDPSGSIEVFDLVIDSGDNLYISVLDKGANQGGFVRKISTTGTTLWTARIEATPTSISSRPKALALDKNNNVYITGDTLDAYPGFSNKGLFDVFVLKYSAAGKLLWTQQFGKNANELGLGIAVSDAVYVAGESSSSVTLVGDPSHGGIDAYLAQLDAATGTLLGVDQ